MLDDEGDDGSTVYLSPAYRKVVGQKTVIADALLSQNFSIFAVVRLLLFLENSKTQVLGDVPSVSPKALDPQPIPPVVRSPVPSARRLASLPPRAAEACSVATPSSPCGCYDALAPAVR